MDEKDKLLTVKNLADYLQVSERTVYRLLKHQKVPYLKVGGQWRFKKEMIEDWLTKEQHVPEKEDTA